MKKILSNFFLILFYIIIFLITIHQLFFNTTRYLFILIFSVIIFLLLKKYFHLINSINKFLLLLITYLCFLQGYNVIEMFYPYPTIINSESYDKAVKISESIINYPIGREFHIDKDSTSIVLHTDNTKIFDKIAIDIAESKLFDNSLKIGVCYRPSANPRISNERLEKYFNNRIKLIHGIKQVDTQIPDNNRIIINVIVDKGKDKDRIFKIINNFLPMPSENKKINISEE